MKFGIIICPHCKKVKGVDLTYKTSKCLHCGKILKIEHLKVFFKTDSQEKLRQAIGQINADVDGNIHEFKKIMHKK